MRYLIAIAATAAAPAFAEPANLTDALAALDGQPFQAGGWVRYADRPVFIDPETSATFRLQLSVPLATFERIESCTFDFARANMAACDATVSGIIRMDGARVGLIADTVTFKD